MLKNLTIICVALAVLSNCKIVTAQGQPYSIYLGTLDFSAAGLLGPITSDPVPGNGFVLTDILNLGSQHDDYIIEQVKDETVEVKTKHYLSTSAVIQLTTGIPFDGGSSIRVNADNGSTRFNITLIGYIPSASAQGIIPAISTWGLSVLGLFILISATLVMARRRGIAV